MPAESALPRLEEQALPEGFLENDTVMEPYGSKGNGEEGGRRFDMDRILAKQEGGECECVDELCLDHQG